MANVKAFGPERRLAAADEVLAKLIDRVGKPGLLVEPLPLFPALVSAITHQQLHGKAAQTILARFVALVPGKRFPTPKEVLALDPAKLRAAGLSGAKTAAIRDLAEHCVSRRVPGPLRLASMSDAEVVTALTAVRGIGVWTVEMLLMFRLGREDVLPVGDFGVRQGFRIAYGLPAMPTPKALLAHGERWRPQRSLAAWYLWRAVDLERAERQAGGRAPRAAPRASKTG